MPKTVKKRILSINTSGFFSTGAIMKNIETGLAEDYDFYHATADEGGSPHYQIVKSHLARQIGKVGAQIKGSDGFAYNWETKGLLDYIESVHPDLLHLHNVHGYYLNIERVLEYAYKREIPIVWTMHDCWTFTGRCAYFDAAGCEKWKDGCGACPAKHAYPRTRVFDRSKSQWLEKKRLFSGHNIHFVAPSNWLRDFAMQSFLRDEAIDVVRNGIDVDLYATSVSGYSLPEGVDPNKKMLLSVAYPFTPEKGLLDIIALYGMIDRNEYQVVLVGIEDEFKTPSGIIRVPPTKEKRYLAFLYQNAYATLLFTKQDNYPTVLLESIAAGTPVIANRLGGVPEIIKAGVNGCSITPSNLHEAVDRIKDIALIDREGCKKSGEENSIANFVRAYQRIYGRLLGE